jgi:hypothetical protein
MGGFWASLVAFANAAFVMVLLMFLLALAVATAQERIVAAMRAHLGQVKRWGGWVLIAVGVWFIVLSIFADFFAKLLPV